MGAENASSKDVVAALNIIDYLIAHPDVQKINKEDIVRILSPEMYSKSSFDRAVRELVRQNVLKPKRKSYSILLDSMKDAKNKISCLNKTSLSSDEVKNRLKQHQFLTRFEINDLLPELSITSIDDLIFKLKNEGFIRNLGEKGRGKYIIGDNREDLYFSDVISKMASVYDDIILRYNSALEYHNLSRYVTTNRLYISGTTIQQIDDLFPKSIENTNLGKLFGTIEVRIDNQSIKVTDLERTILDCIRFPKYALGWENIFFALKRVKDLDEEKILSYLIEYQLPSLSSKVGLLFEHYKKELNLPDSFLGRLSLYKSRTTFRLIRNTPGELNKTWNIYVPANFFNYGQDN